MTTRPEPILQPTQGPAPVMEEGEEFTGALLGAIFSKISQQISGPNRLTFSPAELEAEAASFVDLATDPDETPTSLEEMALDMARQVLPITGEFGTDFRGAPFNPSVPFDASTLPTPDQGKFLTTGSGLLRYTRGVGEAPDNKANTGNPIYQTRARFMGEMYQYALGSFDVEAAGHHRDHDAPVTAQRSPNSDHYSGGAFDVRASSNEEAKKVLAWAASQPWVSFAQIYPDGKLVHISANIGAFTNGQPLPAVQRSDAAARLATKPKPSTSSRGTGSRPVTSTPGRPFGGGPQEF